MTNIRNFVYWHTQLHEQVLKYLPEDEEIAVKDRQHGVLMLADWMEENMPQTENVQRTISFVREAGQDANSSLYLVVAQVKGSPPYGSLLLLPERLEFNRVLLQLEHLEYHDRVDRFSELFHTSTLLILPRPCWPPRVQSLARMRWTRDPITFCRTLAGPPVWRALPCQVGIRDRWAIVECGWGANLP